MYTHTLVCICVHMHMCTLTSKTHTNHNSSTSGVQASYSAANVIVKGSGITCSMYVCLYVCLHGWMDACMHAQIHTRTYLYIYIYTHTRKGEKQRGGRGCMQWYTNEGKARSLATMTHTEIDASGQTDRAKEAPHTHTGDA